MVLSGYGNKAGYWTGVGIAEPQRHPALLCLLLSANATFACAMAKPLHILIFPHVQDIMPIYFNIW